MEKNIIFDKRPLNKRFSDHEKQLFDHADVIAHFCKLIKPNVFLEYGMSNCSTTKIVAPHCKLVIAVDLNPHENMHTIPNLIFHKMTTLEFGKILSAEKNYVIDVAFIDAWHESHTVYQDFEDIFPYVADNGIIFMHDTYPTIEEYTAPEFCYDSWKVPYLIKKFYGDKCEVLTMPLLPGLTIIRKIGKPPNWMNADSIDFDSYIKS